MPVITENIHSTLFLLARSINDQSSSAFNLHYRPSRRVVRGARPSTDRSDAGEARYYLNSASGAGEPRRPLEITVAGGLNSLARKCGWDRSGPVRPSAPDSEFPDWPGANH